MSGFHRSGRHSVHRARSTVRRSTSRIMEGDLHISENHCNGGLPHIVVLSCIWMTAANDWSCFSGLATYRDINGVTM